MCKHKHVYSTVRNIAYRKNILDINMYIRDKQYDISINILPSIMYRNSWLILVINPIYSYLPGILCLFHYVTMPRPESFSKEVKRQRTVDCLAVSWPSGSSGVAWPRGT